MRRPYIIAGPRMVRKASRLYLPASFNRLSPQIIHRLRQRGFIITHLGKSGTPGGPPPSGQPGDAATDWDGATYATTSSLGPSDVATFTYSGWLNWDALANDRLLAHDGVGVVIRPNVSGEIIINVYNPSSVLILDGTTAGGVLTTSTWQHLKCTFNMGATPSNTLEVDGSDVTPTWSTETGGETIHFSTVHGYAADDDGSNDFAGCLSEVWIDDSASTSVTDFRNASTGKPEDLGADGSTPTGAQPLHYFPNGDPRDNKGSQPSWTLQEGAITACSSAPAD